MEDFCIEEKCKITLIGTHVYEHMMSQYKTTLTSAGCLVRMPTFDHTSQSNSAYDIMMLNKESIEWCDEVHMFWDQRSLGTLIDFGMTIGLGKLLRVVFVENRTILDGIMEYEKRSQKATHLAQKKGSNK